MHRVDPAGQSAAVLAAGSAEPEAASTTATLLDNHEHYLWEAAGNGQVVLTAYFYNRGGITLVDLAKDEKCESCDDPSGLVGNYDVPAGAIAILLPARCPRPAATHNAAVARAIMLTPLAVAADVATVVVLTPVTPIAVLLYVIHPGDGC